MSFKILYLSVFFGILAGCSALPPLPASLPAPAPRPHVAPVPPVEAPRTAIPEPVTRRSEALLQTLMALGIDYHYGGQSPTTGFDCSGLVAHVYLEAYG